MASSCNPQIPRRLMDTANPITPLSSPLNTTTDWLLPDDAGLNLPLQPSSSLLLTNPSITPIAPGSNTGVINPPTNNSFQEPSFTPPLTTAELNQTLSQIAASIFRAPSTQIATPTYFQPLAATAPLIAPTHVFALLAGGIVKFNGNSDLDGNPVDLSDDAFIYAEKGFTFNGNTTLPVQRDANGNPLKDSQGKQILIERAVVVAPGYLTSQVNGKNNYANLTPPQIVAKQTLTIPSFEDLKQQELNKIPTGINPTIFNTSTAINNANQWAQKFPTGGTSPTQLQVVKVTGGSLNIPNNVNLNNYLIIVENGSINFNGNSSLNNVTLIANNGNINLGKASGNNVSILASGTINQNSNASFSGKSLIANGAGDLTFNGSTQSVNNDDNLWIVSAGNLTFNSNASVRGSFWSRGNFIANSQSDIYGIVTSLKDITFNGNANFTYANTIDTEPPVITANLVDDSGKSNSDRITNNRF